MLTSTLRRLKTNLAFGRCIRRGLATARAGNDEVIFRKLSDAMRSARQSPSESLAAWAARIETRRRTLQGSPDTLEIVDFGAGALRKKQTAVDGGGGVKTRLRVAQIVQASKQPPWARLLYEICYQIRPTSVLEMGTCVGISAAYLGAALEDRGEGRMITLEGDASIARLAKETLQSCGMSRVVCNIGPFEKTLGASLQELRPVNLVFIDGNHREDATIAYFHELLPFMAPSGVLVFDDINWSPGMERAWKSISQNAACQSVFDLEKIGIVSV